MDDTLKFSHRAKLVWEIAKKYYHSPDVSIESVTIELNVEPKPSHISCIHSHTEWGSNGHGGTCILTRQDTDALYKELQGMGIVEIKHTQKLEIQLQPNKMVEVTQVYII